ncbi:hypothetical protein Q0812_13290 [Brevundimonas sp. 2R-24]|uniref:Uncharacterized protein n=1 Tax=Peiella sedimenti TaxID=3061083 RepID=A0ABT8SQU3_9CAUL|nr:hypothetical protein [Caulobacteraceae bacterium XZ-24]
MSPADQYTQIHSDLAQLHHRIAGDDAGERARVARLILRAATLQAQAHCPAMAVSDLLRGLAAELEGVEPIARELQAMGPGR